MWTVLKVGRWVGTRALYSRISEQSTIDLCQDMLVIVE